VRGTNYLQGEKFPKKTLEKNEIEEPLAVKLRIPIYSRKNYINCGEGGLLIKRKKATAPQPSQGSQTEGGAMWKRSATISVTITWGEKNVISKGGGILPTTNG